jgi:hypothetical protein
VWEVLAGTFLTIDILLYNFRMSKFKYCRRLPCLSSSKFTKLSFFATKCDGWRAVGENIYYIRYDYIYRNVFLSDPRRRTLPEANVVGALSLRPASQQGASVKSTASLPFRFRTDPNGHLRRRSNSTCGR